MLYTVRASMDVHDRTNFVMSMFFFLSDTANRIGGKCLIHLMRTVTGGLMPASWAARWPTTSTLVLQTPHLLSLTSAILRLRVGPHVVDKLVKKYGKSSFRSV